MGGSCFGCDGLNDEAESQPLLRPSSQPQGRSMTASSVSLGQGRVNCNQQPQPQPLPQPLPVSLMRMHLDADRDGLVDAAPANYGDWQWGAGVGGIVMVRTRTPLLQHGLVLERCELSFRWTPGPEPRAGWRAELTLEPADRLLLYPDRTSAAAALVLQHGGVLDIAALPGADAGAVSLWMQAADYGADNHEASWRVRLRFRFVDANGGGHDQNAQLRIAPWIMAGDLDPTVSVFGVGGDPPTDYALQLSNFVTAGQQFRRMNVRHAQSGRLTRKPYVRDVMKSGFSHAPHHRHLVFQQKLDYQASYPIGDGVLYGIDDSGILSRPEWADEDNGSSQNNGGNLLLSPPDDNYPYGRIIYGQRDPDFLCNSAPFYARQRMQAPIRLDSSWLKVGHVDEYLSFVPHAGADWPWKMLMMDPWLGYALAHAASARPAAPNLDDLCDVVERVARESRLAGEDFAALLQRCEDEDRIGPVLDNPSPAPAGVVAYAASPPPPANQNGKVVTFSPTEEDGSNPRTCRAANFAGFIVNGDHAGWFNMVAGHLAADRATLLRELGRADEDVIGMPVLLWVENAEHRVMTATADSVNMLVLRQGNGARCLVPKPFGPVCADTYLFEHYTNRKLVELGLAVTFVNDWVALHCDDGEVHCGTNQIPALDQLSTRPDATAADRTWWLRAPT